MRAEVSAGKCEKKLLKKYLTSVTREILAKLLLLYSCNILSLTDSIIVKGAAVCRTL